MWKDSTLGLDIIENKINPQDLVLKDIKEFASEEMKEKWKIQEEIAKDKSRTDYNIESRIAKGNGFYKCPKCKSQSTDFFLLQTRSSDEPMTTFASCFACGNNWKF